MNKSKKIKTFTAAYSKYIDIQDDRDLRKNHITLCEYHVIFDILKELSDITEKKAETISEGVANWFKRNGFAVAERGVGFSISLG